MPVLRPSFYNYDNARDGNLAVGTTVSPWFDMEGLTHVWLQGSTFTGGTTQIIVDWSADGITVASSSTDQYTAQQTGVFLPVAARYARIRLVQATAVATAGFTAAQGRYSLGGVDASGNPNQTYVGVPGVVEKHSA
jgi:hypothetical protein